MKPAAPTPSAPGIEAPAPSPAAFHHYLPISDAIFDGGVFVTSVGAGRVAAGESYPLVGHPSLYDFKWKDGRTLPEFSIMLITSGRGLFESRAAGPVPVEAGEVIMIFPGVWHRYRPDSATGWSEKWMHFNGELAHRLLAQGVFSPEQPVWRPADAGRLEAELDRLRAVVQLRPSENSLRISLQGLAIIAAALNDEAAADAGASLARPPTAPAKSVTDPLVQQAVHHIWTQGHKEMAVAHVAAALGVNRRTLERRFRLALGRGILEEIIDCRFNRAERLVRETDLPLKSVLGLAGFSGMENMRRVFLARTGRSPAAYRATQRRRA
jgi:AraC-like DNA-binding protein